MYADVVVSAEITEHIRGLSQLIRWQDVFKLVYDRTYQIEVLQDRTGPDQTGPAILDRSWIKHELEHCCFCKIHGAH